MDFEQDNDFLIYLVSFLGSLSVLPGNIISALLMDRIGRLKMIGECGQGWRICAPVGCGSGSACIGEVELFTVLKKSCPGNHIGDADSADVKGAHRQSPRAPRGRSETSGPGGGAHRHFPTKLFCDSHLLYWHFDRDVKCIQSARSIRLLYEKNIKCSSLNER